MVKVLNYLKKINMPLKKIKEYVDLTLKGDESLVKRHELIK